MPRTTAIKRHGGKAYQADADIAMFPPRDSYVVFASTHFGGGSTELRHDPEGKSEVVNDLDGELTNFWRVMQRPLLFEAFKRRLEATPFSQVEFRIASSPRGNAIVQAAKFFIRNRQSRQGLERDFATPSKNRTRCGMDEQVASWLGAIEGLPEFHKRLRRVKIYNEDAIRFIERMDGPRTFFYIDPPYLHETRSHTSSYKHEMTEEDHANLLIALGKIKGKFMLCGYPSHLYTIARDSRGWHYVERPIDNKASSKRTKDKKIEARWMNYNPDDGR